MARLKPEYRDRVYEFINHCRAAAPLRHEQVVLPTKAMRPGVEDYAVACAVPSNAEGLHIVNTTNAPRCDDQGHYPLGGDRICTPPSPTALGPTAT